MIISAIIVLLVACLGIFLSGLKLIEAIQNRERAMSIVYSVFTGVWVAIVVLRVISLIAVCVGG